MDRIAQDRKLFREVVEILKGAFCLDCSGAHDGTF